MRPSLRTITLALATTATAASPVLWSSSAGAAGELYVATTGLDSNPGTAAAPLRSVQAAVTKATPGTTIKIQPGTYTGAIKIKTSGTAAAPIRITAVTPGTVQLTYASRPQPCDNSQPAADRTITIANGADHWQIDNLAIHNGLWISGKKSNVAYSWLTNLVNQQKWAARRAVPSHGSYDPAATASIVPYLRSVTGVPDIDSADGIKILDNDFTGRGIYGALTSKGVIANNTISKVPCGIGPGIWLMTFSHSWQVYGNDVTDIAVSTRAHYMQEGIRFGSAADYNEIYNNNVHDLPGDGRGINTDVDASWNYIHHNTVSNLAIGYNEQMSGWGNRWEYNQVNNYRVYGMGFRLKDGQLTAPSKSTSSHLATVKCNVMTGAVGTAKAVGIGGMTNGTFVGNTAPLIFLSKNLQTYWSAQGNTWDGSSALPSRTPTVNTTGC